MWAQEPGEGALTAQMRLLWGEGPEEVFFFTDSDKFYFSKKKSLNQVWQDGEKQSRKCGNRFCHVISYILRSIFKISLSKERKSHIAESFPLQVMCSFSGLWVQGVP